MPLLSFYLGILSMERMKYVKFLNRTNIIHFVFFLNKKCTFLRACFSLMNNVLSKITFSRSLRNFLQQERCDFSFLQIFINKAKENT